MLLLEFTYLLWVALILNLYAPRYWPSLNSLSNTAQEFPARLMGSGFLENPLSTFFVNGQRMLNRNKKHFSQVSFSV